VSIVTNVTVLYQISKGDVEEVAASAFVFKNY
jgi:hypothetical protein